MLDAIAPHDHQALSWRHRKRLDDGETTGRLRLDETAETEAARRKSRGADKAHDQYESADVAREIDDIHARE